MTKKYVLVCKKEILREGFRKAPMYMARVIAETQDFMKVKRYWFLPAEWIPKNGDMKMTEQVYKSSVYNLNDQ